MWPRARQARIHAALADDSECNLQVPLCFDNNMYEYGLVPVVQKAGADEPSMVPAGREGAP